MPARELHYGSLSRQCDFRTMGGSRLGKGGLSALALVVFAGCAQQQQGDAETGVAQTGEALIVGNVNNITEIGSSTAVAKAVLHSFAS